MHGCSFTRTPFYLFPDFLSVDLPLEVSSTLAAFNFYCFIIAVFFAKKMKCFFIFLNFHFFFVGRKFEIMVSFLLDRETV